MAFLLSTARATSSTKNIDEVYVSSVPLRATKGPGRLLMSTAYSLNLWDVQHFMVIIKPSSPIHLNQPVVFDFQPKDPESIQVALAALSGGVVPGLVCMRTMTMLPKRKCWLIGVCEGDAVNRAKAFNEDWDTDLTIGQHDCRDYTDGLIEYLTGKKQVLKEIKGTFDSSK